MSASPDRAKNDVSNEHLHASEAKVLLEDALAELEEKYRDGRVEVESLGKLKTVADATTKFLLRTNTAGPIAVVLCSRPKAPELVERGVRQAEAVRKIVGDDLGEAIIRPIRSGYVEGRSYAVYPYCREFSSWRPRRIFQRKCIQRSLFTWLRNVTNVAARVHAVGAETCTAYANALSHLVQVNLFNNEIVNAARAALDRLDSGQWKPRHTCDHNDLYMSNIMLPARTAEQRAYPFTIIDWAGANSKGYGIYDLVRLARAVKLSDKAMSRELRIHTQSLGGGIKDAPGHLLASLGRLHQHLEEFPLDRFLYTAQECWRTLHRGMNAE